MTTSSLIVRALACLLLCIPFAGAPALAQDVTLNAPCGVVDSIDYPIDITDTLTQRYDDFALFRARFFGNHLGIDIGFERWGDPVYAAARGIVTLSNITEWDTEKGVVVVRHTFPDGTTAYTLYGHMEVGETVAFPPEGSCVERGDVVGLIGWPSRGLPHLHYEIRTGLPNEGGPGYIEGNPLTSGWYHPIDFTELWQTRLEPGFIEARTFTEVPALPPVALDDGSTVLAGAQSLTGFLNGVQVWQITTDGVIVGLGALPGGRVAAHTRSGQVLVLQGARFAGVFTVEAMDAPFQVVNGDTLVFVTRDGGLAAYGADGGARWTLPTVPGADADGAVMRVGDFRGDGSAVALGLRVNGETTWRMVDGAGTVVFEGTYSGVVTSAASPDGSWLLLNDTSLLRIAGGQATPVTTLSVVAGRAARIAFDNAGNTYVYANDADATLLSLDSAGDVRWRVTYPLPSTSLAPLMSLGGGCLLYTLDVDGMLNVFSAATGELAGQRQLYAGGDRSGSPRGRLLQITPEDIVRVGAGFLTIATFDGRQLAPQAGC
jgi:hypothetical protein